MKLKVTLALMALTTSAANAITTVNLTVDQWQNPYPFEWVNQTQSTPGFSLGQEYAGFFSGLVDGQRWLFMCMSENVNINVGQAYSFTMYSPAEFIDAPYASNGNMITGQQKSAVQELLTEMGIAPVSGFIAPVAQNLVGVPWSDSVQAILGDITPREAALTQLGIWDAVHGDVFSWTWQNGEAINRNSYSASITAIPEPQLAAILPLLLVSAMSIRRRK